MAFVRMPLRSVSETRSDVDYDRYWHTWTRQIDGDALHVEVLSSAEATEETRLTIAAAEADALPPSIVSSDSSAPGTIVLRDYQRASIEALDRAWRQGHRAPLLVLPTGSGKTIIASAVMGNLHEVHGKRSLFMAHRRELLEQTAAKVRLVSTCRVGVVQGNRNDLGHDITVGSIQTLGHHSGRRMEAVLAAGPYDLLVVDEAHHAVSPQWQGVIDALRRENPGMLLFGMTATPGRADGSALDAVFDTVAYERRLTEMIDEGWLVPPRGFKVTLDIDLDKIKMSRGDFVGSQLSQAMNTPLVNEAVVRAWQQFGHDRKTLAFAVDVAHGYALRDTFVAAGYAAEALDGKTKDKERKAVLQRFRDGQTRILVNCQVLTEGYDDPSTEAILFARPTQSQGLYVQMLGRGLRPWPGKSDCFVIDAVGNGDRHQPMQLASLSGFEPDRRVNSKVGDGVNDEDLAFDAEDDPEVLAVRMRGEEVRLTGHARPTRYKWRETTLGFVLQIPRVGYYLVAWSDHERTQCTIRFFDQRRGKRDDPPRDVLTQPVSFEMAYGLVEAEMDRLFKARLGRRTGFAPDDHVPDVSFVDMEDGLTETMFAEREMLKDAKWRDRPMSVRQSDLLVKLGVKQGSLPELMGEASDLIAILQVQRDAKMRVPATHKQLGYLRMHKVVVRDGLTKGAAAKLIFRHRNGFLKPEEGG